MVLPKVEELEDIGVPWLNINGEGTWTLVAALVDVTCGRVVSTEHWHDAIRVSIRPSDVISATQSVGFVDT